MSRVVRDGARRALADVPFNVGFARAVVDGVVDGELWSDRPADPRAFHAVHPCGMSLVWGPDVDAVADDVVRHLRDRAARGVGEWLQIDPRWDGLDWDRMLDAVPLAQYTAAEGGGGPAGRTEGHAAADASGHTVVGAVRRTRVNFAFEPSAFAARAPALAPATADAVGRLLRVRRAAEADHAWQGSTVPGRFWPDARSFLAHGGGWVVEVDDVPAAIAFCSFRVDGDDDVEIGIETVATFRRQGLARLVAAAMIEDLVASHLTPVWSCREDNVGSLRLAEALGFAPSRWIPYFQVLPRVD